MKLHLEHHGTQDMVKMFSFAAPLLTWPTQVSNILGVGRGNKFTKIGLAMGVIIGDYSEKVVRTLIC